MGNKSVDVAGEIVKLERKKVVIFPTLVAKINPVVT